jgi:hypothetical protein
MSAGRPTTFRDEFVEQAYKLCLLGATDVEMAAFFGTSEQTLNAWKKAHPQFLESITRGKLQADAEVAEKLYRRALGYSHEAVKIFMPAGASEPVYAKYTEHYPPDTQAASLWLRNRQSAKWRDKQELEHTVRTPPLEQMPDEELLRIIARGRPGADAASPTPRGQPTLGKLH